MKLAPIPKNEKERLGSLYKLGLLDTKPEKRFDRITRAATKIFNVPISTLTLIDSKREWFKSVCGLDQKEGDRAISFCGHALLANEVFVVTDTKKDSRFSDNPMVIGKPFVRFYAGVPIMNTIGERVGVFCIKDIKPRKFSKDSEEMLKNLATWAELEINSRNLGLALNEVQKAQSRSKVLMQGLENQKIAARNVMEDLDIEKSKVEIARAKEEAILLSIGDGLLATDEKGNITLMNNTAEKLLGLKSQEVLGKYYFEVITLEDEKGVAIPREKRPISIALTGGTTTTTTGFSYYCVRKDKTRFPVAITVTPVRLNKQVIGVIDIFRDTTKETEVDRAKSEFVSLASHQLKTPLTAINWYTELLLEGDAGKTNQQQAKYLREVSRSSHRMVELVNSLLNVSRLEMGTFIIEPEPTDVVALSKDVVKELQPTALKRRQLVTEGYGSNIAKMNIDQKLLRMVLQNQLGNAIKYTPQKGTISISIKEVERELLITVGDSGCGIPQRQQDQIFSKMFRADNARELDSNGTGLGLYIVKSILNASGGSIRFDSEENVGTTFYVAIPTSGMKQKTGTKTLS